MTTSHAESMSVPPQTSGLLSGWTLIPNSRETDDVLRVRTIRHETFHATEDQVSQARHVTQQTLLDHPAAEIAVLLVSELTSNSIRHSGSRFFTLAIIRTFDEELHVKVSDEGHNGLPRLLGGDLTDESGRDIRLVDTLSKQWGITRRRGSGMAVWFDVDEDLPEGWLDLLIPDAS
ncbi:ATP-binding protein [Sphaerisporangium sp. NPDC049003]|uniref:ATP-binding protein n=1 Tax=Sphaerisporangium sp. NPDC049003 TaxID=3364517 RepID=UPI00371224A8